MDISSRNIYILIVQENESVNFFSIFSNWLGIFLFDFICPTNYNVLEKSNDHFSRKAVIDKQTTSTREMSGSYEQIQ